MLKLNPQNLLGIDEFNQAFFDKIDQIEIDISNEIDFNSIIENLNIKSFNITNFKFSENKNEIEKKIFELRKINLIYLKMKMNIFLYKINKSEQRKPDLNDNEIKKEIIELIHQKNKFDYNKKLIRSN